MSRTRATASATEVGRRLRLRNASTAPLGTPPKMRATVTNSRPIPLGSRPGSGGLRSLVRKPRLPRGGANVAWSIAAVGASDSHTVAAFPVGQARTYVHIKGAAQRPDPADIASAMARGETMVSYGLVAQLTLAGHNALVRVYGPSWNRAEKLLIYSNGQVAATRVLRDTGRGGLKWSGTVHLPKIKQDAWIVAVVVGPGVQEPFWEVLRPYQPSTPVWQPMTLGVSQAAQLDGDGDGRFECARAIAEGLTGPGAEEPDLVRSLNRHDQAVAAQAAFLLAKRDRLPSFLLRSGQVLHPDIRASMSEVLRQWQAAFR